MSTNIPLKEISIVVRDINDSDVAGEFLVLTQDEKNIKDAIASASEEFCQTEKGKRVLRENNGVFGYWEFFAHVPNEICFHYGFQKVMGGASRAIIDVDRPLVENHSFKRVG